MSSSKSILKMFFQDQLGKILLQNNYFSVVEVHSVDHADPSIHIERFFSITFYYFWPVDNDMSLHSLFCRLLITETFFGILVVDSHIY